MSCQGNATTWLRLEKRSCFGFHVFGLSRLVIYMKPLRSVRNKHSVTQQHSVLQLPESKSYLLNYYTTRSPHLTISINMGCNELLLAHTTFTAIFSVGGTLSVVVTPPGLTWPSISSWLPSSSLPREHFQHDPLASLTLTT